MTIEHLVARYGLAALFLGAGFEGETAVVLGGVLAHAGYFPLPAAMAAAAAGSCAADQVFFVIGRYFRDSRLARWAKAKPVFARARDWIERYPIGFTFAFRFIYGFRTVSPFAIGATDVSTRLFVAVNVVAAIVWGCLFTALGYVFGRTVERWLGDHEPNTRTLLIAGSVAVGVLALVALAQRWRGARRGP